MKAEITTMWASPSTLHLRLLVSFRSTTHVQFANVAIPIEAIDPAVIAMLVAWHGEPDRPADQPGLF